MSSKPAQSRYRIISIMTVLILVMSFAYYYFIYVQSREDAFNAKAFRIIESVGTNVEKKFNNYNSIIENFASYHVVYTNALTTWRNEYGYDSREYLNNFSIPGSVTIKLNYDFGEDETFDLNTVLTDNLIVTSQPVYFEDDFYVISAEYDINSLFEGTLRRDFFQDYIIFTEHQVFYSDIPTDKYIDVKIDSIFRKEKYELSNLFHSTDKVEIQFNDETHLLYVTPMDVAGKTIYIGASVSKSFLRQQSFKLGTNTLIVIVVLLIMLMLSMPFLKLALISESERLTIWDTVISFAVMLLGGAFICLSLLTYFTQQGPSSAHKQDLLRKYSTAIENNFINELDAILQQIDKNNQLLRNDLVAGVTDYQINHYLFEYDRTREDKTGFDNSLYPYYTGANWMNSKGHQMVKWKDENITARVNLKNRRSYFDVPNNMNAVLWSHNKLRKHGGFYVEAIHSFNDGKKYTMISQRVDDIGPLAFNDSDFVDSFYEYDLLPAVISLSTTMQSMEKLPIPNNISYMVIDENGRVFFHTNKIKVLQENFLDELDQDASLLGAIYSRKPNFFSHNYDESYRRFFINPIGEMPLYLVTYLDAENETLFDAQILSLSTFLYLVLFLLIVLEVVLFIAVDYKRKRKTSGYNRFLSWMRPDEKKNRVYMMVSAYILISMLLYLFGSIGKDILMSFSYFIFLTLFCIAMLRQYKSTKEVFGSPKTIGYFVVMVGAAFVFYFNADFNGVFESIYYFLFLIVSVLILAGTYKLKQGEKQGTLRHKYNHWVILYIFSLTALPVFTFFINSYNLEKHVYLKQIQFELAKTIAAKDQEANSKNQSTNKNPYQDYVKLNNQKFTFALSKEKVDSIEADDQEPDIYDRLRWSMTTSSQKSASLHFSDSSHIDLAVWSVEADSSVLRYVKSLNSDGTANVLTIKAAKQMLWPSEILFRGEDYKNQYHLMVLALIIIIIVLYLMVEFWSLKVFLLGIIPMLKSKVAKFIDISEFSYIICPPFSGVAPFLNKKFKDKYFQIDLRYQDSFDDDEYRPEIPEGVEVVFIYDSESISSHILKVKTGLIHYLKGEVYKKEELKKIILISQTSPHQIIKPDVAHLDKHIVNKYLDVLGNFTTSYFPIAMLNFENSAIMDDFMRTELRPLRTLKGVEVADIYNEIGGDQEDNILNLQNKMQLYYFAVWNSLEKREKFLIYDLSQDGLVNYRNLPVIFNLISRGILVWRSGQLELFNKSFSNFVISIIDKDEALEIERESKISGNWSNLKLPFMLIIVAIVAFIILTQQELLTEMMGWMTAALAFLPIVSRLLMTSSAFGLFKSKNKAQEKSD